MSAQVGTSVPYGPLWFGGNPGADYTLANLNVFSGAFITPNSVNMSAAQNNGIKVMVALYSGGTPCTYWNDVNPPTPEVFASAVVNDHRSQIAMLANYYPDTLVGVGVFNEAHWINNPTATCSSGIPPRHLYEMYKRIRQEFAANGVTNPNLMLGPNSPPSYLNNSESFPRCPGNPCGLAANQLTAAEKLDGTINMMWIYYDIYNNTLSTAQMQQQIARNNFNTKIVYNANAGIAGTQLPEVGIWHCQQEDAGFVTWWSWVHGNLAVPVSALAPVRAACDGNIVPTLPPPGPTVALGPTPTRPSLPYITVAPISTPVPGVPTPIPSPTSIPRKPFSPVFGDDCETLDPDGIPSIKDIECIFASVVNIALGFAGLALFIMLIIGGFKYLTSAGDPKAVESAQKTLTYAILGIVLIALSFLILVFIETFTGINLTIFSVTI